MNRRGFFKSLGVAIVTLRAPKPKPLNGIYFRHDAFSMVAVDLPRPPILFGEIWSPELIQIRSENGLPMLTRARDRNEA